MFPRIVISSHAAGYRPLVLKKARVPFARVLHWLTLLSILKLQCFDCSAWVLKGPLDISEIGFPGISHVFSQFKLDPSPKPCPGMTEMVSGGLPIWPNWMSILLTTDSVYGAK